jgi:hypothetical protein
MRRICPGFDAREERTFAPEASGSAPSATLPVPGQLDRAREFFHAFLAAPSPT